MTLTARHVGHSSVHGPCWRSCTVLEFHGPPRDRAGAQGAQHSAERRRDVACGRDARETRFEFGEAYHQRTGVKRPAACSITSPSENSVSSSKARPTSCRPSGSPCDVLHRRLRGSVRARPRPRTRAPATKPARDVADLRPRRRSRNPRSRPRPRPSSRPFVTLNPWRWAPTTPTLPTTAGVPKRGPGPGRTSGSIVLAQVTAG